jgi:fumarylacetoacetate (FAA) hydrolase family protein
MIVSVVARNRMEKAFSLQKHKIMRQPPSGDAILFGTVATGKKHNTPDDKLLRSHTMEIPGKDCMLMGQGVTHSRNDDRQPTKTTLTDLVISLTQREEEDVGRILPTLQCTYPKYDASRSLQLHPKYVFGIKT